MKLDQSYKTTISRNRWLKQLQCLTKKCFFDIDLFRLRTVAVMAVEAGWQNFFDKVTDKFANF